MKLFIKLIPAIVLSLVINNLSFGQQTSTKSTFAKVDKEVKTWMEEGQIPGMSLVLIKNGQVEFKNYGYSDLERKTSVTENTLFQIGSCSKAFTGYALMQMVASNEIDLEANVKTYIPWLNFTYQGKKVDVKIKYLLHHTSGIPWRSISKIPEASGADALEKTVRAIQNYELESLPGENYEYATINYDVLALVIQNVSKQSFESYMETNVFEKLELTQTSIGADIQLSTVGYKNSFLSPRKYDAPIYSGNNAAGYIVSNAKDMARWLQVQLGNDSIVRMSHVGDQTVAIHGESLYAAGWELAMDGTQSIYHAGLNPNFTSYVSFNRVEQCGVVILTNSDSQLTSFIGDRVQKILLGKEVPSNVQPPEGIDGTFTLISSVVAVFLLLLVIFVIRMFVQIVQGKRAFHKLQLTDVKNILWMSASLTPFIVGIYLLPDAMSGFNWASIQAWVPNSFVWAFDLLNIAILATFGVYVFGKLFPEKSKYKQMLPSILLVSMLTGLSGVMIIMMVTSSLNSVMSIGYLSFYYSLILIVYLLGRRFVQKKLIDFTNSLMYDLRIRIIQKIFSTSYQKFERIDNERVYTTLNDDVITIGNSTGTFVTLFTSLVTVIGAFIYLASIAFWATVTTIVVIAFLTIIGFYIIHTTRKYFEGARDSQNGFVSLINGLIDGYKELSIQKNKKRIYRDEMSVSAATYKEKVSLADLKAFDASLVGESMLVILLGVAAIGMRELFPSIELYAIMNFVMVLLYLIGPVNGILQSAPQISHVMVAWKRIQGFTEEIPSSSDIESESAERVPNVERLAIQDAYFSYETSDAEKSFGIGPINLEAEKGDIIFIIGGNGSGKTTLAKLLTGLYAPDKGSITVNNNSYQGHDLSELYSCVFSPAHLFKKMYNVDLSGRESEIESYLTDLNLSHKVSIDNGEFNTIKLSSGQRKRLALLQCYMEDSPIYLFDEWAADQDPEYRKYFYRKLLPEMKRKGKIVMAITHDDNYFDVADKVFKMSNGVLEDCTESLISSKPGEVASSVL